MRQTIPTGLNRFSPHVGVPPPPLNVELVDAGRAVGWIADARLGFRGFATDIEAAHAAWVAWRALQRRTARRLGERPVPVDTEPLTIRRSDDGETIFAGARPIGTLLRPGSGTRAGPNAFAFELQLPASTGELGMRAKTYVLYRALRKSGIRWALWRPGVTRELGTIVESTPERDASERVSTDRTILVPEMADATRTQRRRDAETTPMTQSVSQVMTLRAHVTFTAIAIVAGVVLLAMAPPLLVASIALFLLAPFLAFQAIMRIDKRNARMHALRTAGSDAPDLAATRPDGRTADRTREGDAPGASGHGQPMPSASTRRARSLWNRSVVPHGALRVRGAWRRGVELKWMGVAMLGATMAAVAFLDVDMREVAVALTSAGAVACIGLAALRLSEKRRRWARRPARVGFALAGRASRDSWFDRPGYHTELHTTRRRSSHEVS